MTLSVIETTPRAAAVLRVPPEADRVLRVADVAALYGYSKSHLYVKIRRGEIPPPDVALGPSTPQWRLSTIQKHIASMLPPVPRQMPKRSVNRGGRPRKDGRRPTK